MSQPLTYTTPCHSCEGQGGWTDYGRGWDCYSGPEPDEWVPCEECEGKGELTHECDELPPSPPTPARRAQNAPVRVVTTRPIDDTDLECDWDDSDPFADDNP